MQSPYLTNETKNTTNTILGIHDALISKFQVSLLKNLNENDAYTVFVLYK